MNPIPSLGHVEAQQAIEAIKNEALKRGKAVVMTVADAHGELIALLRMDGASLTSIQIATNKAYTAARAGQPSHNIGQAARHPQDGFDISYYGDPKIMGWPGGMPVIVDGAVVGGIGVSGLAGSEDLELVQVGLDAIAAALK
jgi:glc operon protein GlcG